MNRLFARTDSFLRQEESTERPDRQHRQGQLEPPSQEGWNRP